MPLSTIVVPVDFSGRSVGAARHAEAIQRVFSSTIILLHVLPPPHYEYGAMEIGGSVIEEIFQNRRDQAHSELRAFMADELPPFNTERQVMEGDPALAIVKLARDRGAGLIVLPTHGYGPFRRFILGSVTAKVLHDADCPVWTGVHLEAVSVDAIHFRHLAVGVDLGAQSERTLMWASRFARDAGAKLSLIHATPAMEGRAGEYFDPEWRVHMETAAREEIEELQARLDTQAPLYVQSGEAAATVCRIACEIGADLLVIGRGSAAGVFGRLRANAYSIIRESRMPVVSV